MRAILLSSFAAAVLSATCVAHAEPVDFTHIPADALGYVHADLDRSQATMTKLFAKPNDPKPDAVTLSLIRSMMPNSLTAIFAANDKPVVLAHASAEFRNLILQMVDGPNASTINYDGKSIKFVTMSEDSAYLMAVLGPMIAASKAAGKTPAGKPIGNLTAGKQQKTTDIYLANLDDKGLLVGATDLRRLITELDVLSGKSDSLAKSDKRKLKLDPSPNTLLLGCFDVAALESHDATADEATADKIDNDALAKFLEVALTGSEEIKIQQVQLLVSEDGKDFNADINLTMADSASAEQMKRLSMGVKALLSTTNPDAKQYLESLNATAKDQTTQLHWSLSESKLTTWFDDQAAAYKASHEGK